MNDQDLTAALQLLCFNTYVGLLACNDGGGLLEFLIYPRQTILI